MKKVFIVTRGEEYSSVLGIFSSKQLAQQYIDSFEYTGDFNEVEERVLNPYEEQLNKGYMPFTLCMMKDGSGIEIQPLTFPLDLDGESDISCAKLGDQLVFSLFAKDEKHAIELANKERLRLIAEKRLF